MIADYTILDEKVNEGRPTRSNIAQAISDPNHEHHQLICEAIVIESVKALIHLYDDYRELF